MEGRLAAPVAEELVLERVEPGPADTLRIPARAVERLWLEVSRADQGALWGGIAGVALGGLVGAVVGNGLCDAADCTSQTWEGAARGGALFGLAGVGIGATVGAASRGWRQLHP